MASQLKQLKTDNALTWERIAVLFGVTVGAVHHWTSGKRAMPGSAVILCRLYADQPELIKTVLADF